MEYEENKVDKVKTLMQTLERLDQEYSRLETVTNLTATLFKKLNRTEDLVENNSEMQKQAVVPKNIVELFDDLIDKIESRINMIGDNTERSMRMID